MKQIEGVSTLVNLTELYICQNKLKQIGEELRGLTNLTTLELGSNRLKAIENIDTLTNLKNLWVGRNRLMQIKVRQVLFPLILK